MTIINLNHKKMIKFILTNINTGVKENLNNLEINKRIHREKDFFYKYTYCREQTILEKIFNNKYVLNFLFFSALCLCGFCIASLILEGVVFFTK